MHFMQVPEKKLSTTLLKKKQKMSLKQILVALYKKKNQ